jgi:Ca2+-binding EF-hand superfamily protein
MYAKKRALLAAALCLGGLLADVTSTTAQESASDRAKRWFSEHDRNHDGYLIADEVIAYELKQLSRMDRFEDGNISPQEYCAGIAPNLTDDAARCHSRFAKIDANSDGYITAEEVTNFYRHAMKAADQNGDGKVSLEEWLSAMGEN